VSDPNSGSSPFTDLPGALVEEVMQRTGEVGSKLLQSFEHVRSERATFRTKLQQSGRLGRDTDLEYPPIPSTCAVDGSYAVERLLTTDLAAAAAVAVEGLTPPSEKRFWEQPRHEVSIEAETHHEATNSVLRGVMMTMELSLATKAPHDVVFLDGSMTTPVIYLNQSLSQARYASALKLSTRLRQRSKSGMAAYLEILQSKRADKCWTFCPKYTTNREIGKAMDWPDTYDDRGLLTMLLDAGEFTKPISLQAPESEWHINTAAIPDAERNEADELEGRITAELQNVVVIYYKPHTWMPALRLEVNQSVASNRSRLAVLLHGVKHQCGTPAILEPFPLYMADRMVKSLARAVPAFRAATTQRIAETYTGSLDEVFYGMHGFRTDSGG
jgi:hypothetical protein